MNIFYSNIIDNNIIILDKTETNHCINVMRYQIGDEIFVVDGMGSLYTCIINKIKHKQCYLDINTINKHYDELDYFIHIGISPTKNHERLEWFVEKSIEIGIDEVSFINCNRTLRKNIRIKRINKVLLTYQRSRILSD